MERIQNVQEREELLERAIARYRRDYAGLKPDQPCFGLSDVEERDGGEYVSLRNVRGELARYKIINGRLYNSETK